MNRIVYNKCFGGFGLSEEAGARYRELKGRAFGGERHCPVLLQVVEEMGPAANGFCADLAIEEIKGSRYRIDEYDGAETVQEPDDIDWVEIENGA